MVPLTCFAVRKKYYFSYQHKDMQKLLLWSPHLKGKHNTIQSLYNRLHLHGNYMRKIYWHFCTTLLGCFEMRLMCHKLRIEKPSSKKIEVTTCCTLNHKSLVLLSHKEIYVSEPVASYAEALWAHHLWFANEMMAEKNWEWVGRPNNGVNWETCFTCFTYLPGVKRSATLSPELRRPCSTAIWATRSARLWSWVVVNMDATVPWNTTK